MAGENAPAGGGTPAAPVEGGNLDVNDLVNQVVGKRVKKAVEKAFADLRGELANVVKEAMSAQRQNDKPTDKPIDQAQAPGNSAAEQVEARLTLKALQDQIEREKKARLDMENRLKEADARAKSERMRSEVQQRASAKLGADNPMLAMWMSHFYDVGKRVTEQDGNYYVEFKDAAGEKELRALDDAFGTMFDKNGEYHHLVVPQSKVGSLPPRTVPARGQIVNGQIQRNGAMTSPDVMQHPIYGTVVQHLRSLGDADKAAGLEHVVSLPQPDK